jgi:hydrogenase maturation protein HypF
LSQKAAGTENPVRLIISVRGVVQGVGFRPFVYQLVTRHGLKGWVCNTSEDVKIDLEGEQAALDQFLIELEATAPPLALIESVSTTSEEPVGYERFEILKSVAEEGKYQLVSPDVATCSACLKEVLSPDDRRYRYPFTNCTNCGPRFTIIEDIPYDRPKTTMRHFQMCPECQQEYDNPLDRRFHAQPNACPRCGPSLELVDNRGVAVGAEDTLSETGRLLREGSIVAVKGLGGFLLACDATNEKVVKLLRERKKRPSKPFAVMLTSLEEAEEHCEVSEAEKELLTSHQCPIVLLRWKPGSTVTAGVAPGLKHLGVMLPYTPIHHILMRETGLPLVMTSP